MKKQFILIAFLLSLEFIYSHDTNWEVYEKTENSNELRHCITLDSSNNGVIMIYNEGLSKTEGSGKLSYVKKLDKYGNLLSK